MPHESRIMAKLIAEPGLVLFGRPLLSETSVPVPVTDPHGWSASRDAPLMRDPAHFLIRDRSPGLNCRMGLIPPMLSGCRLWPEAALRPEVRPEAHVDEEA